MMSGWTFVLIVIGFLSIALGALAGARNWRRSVNLAFLSLSIAVAAWVFGIAGFIGAATDSAAFFYAKLFYVAPLFIVLMLTYFSYLFPNERKLPVALATIPAIPVVLLSICIITIPSFITTRVIHKEWGREVQVDQLQYLLYALTVIGMFILSYAVLYWKMKKLRGYYRKQVKWFLISGVVTSLIGGWFNIVVAHWMHDFRYVWIGPLAITFYLASCAISIARHHMFDIRIVAVRTLAYLLSISALSASYFGLAYLATTSEFISALNPGALTSPMYVLLALLLAFIFQPLKQFFDRMTDRLFFRDRYITEEFIERLGKVLTSTVVIDELLKSAAQEIAVTLKATFATFAIYHDQGHTLLSGTTGGRSISDSDIQTTRRMLEGAAIGEVIDTQSLKIVDRKRDMSYLTRRNVALVLSLGDDVGFLLLGEQKGGGYARRDAHVLKTIANELVIAIQNARSVEEVQDLNEGLQRRIDAATKELRSSNKQLLELDETKDEFISMASHQLRTPLTSVKGYVSMVLEGDAGKITPTQRKLLEEAYASSERMVHLIGDFLNVSRIQTGKFMLERHETDLSEVIRQEVEGMKQIADSHGVKLTYRKPKVFPMMYLDDGKLRQVIMNFLDNAIYYSPDNTPVTVTASLEDGNAVVRIVDKGMGVPLVAQKKLFTKFFRAENARTQRPDGTGVGLFLAKKVVDEHGGSIVFESTEGKGSTFGFRLPVKKLAEPPLPVEDQ